MPERGSESSATSSATEDYVAWERFMRSRRGRWTVDPIHDGEAGRRLLCFCPDATDETRGVFVEVGVNGIVRAGTYEDALPHIGDALFRPRWERDFGSPREALRVVVERLGVPFLLGLIEAV